MSQLWNTSGNPAAATTGQTLAVAGGYLINGIKTAITRYSGSSDPSTGAPTAWGVSEVGVEWLDTTDVDTTVTKQWQRLTAAPTYGWRTLKHWKVIFLTTPAAITFTTASPAVADVAYEDVSLSTLLDSNQDAGQVLPKVRAVLVRRRCKEAGTIPTDGSDNVSWKFREKGSTNEFALYPQVATRYVEDQVWVGLDSNEKFQHQVDVAAASPTLTYEAWVVAIAEQL